MEKRCDSPILEISGLSVSFQMYDNTFGRKDLQVISDLHMRVYAGEMLAVVGSSGSGKSLLASAILGILPKNAAVDGVMRYCGQNLTPAPQRRLRGNGIALVPQSVEFLDPLMRVGTQVDGHGKRPVKEGRDRGQSRRKIFQRLGLPRATERCYPFQLSGGMARRVLVSTALIQDAQLIVADEPTPGMGADQAREALRLFRAIADDGKAVILITHDLDLALAFADRIAVFYAGMMVETADASDFQNGQGGINMLRHPYSRALCRALPQNQFEPVAGFQPYAGSLPKGCPFAPRCSYRSQRCEQKTPPVRSLRGGEVRCFCADATL